MHLRAYTSGLGLDAFKSSYVPDSTLLKSSKHMAWAALKIIKCIYTKITCFYTTVNLQLESKLMVQQVYHLLQSCNFDFSPCYELIARFDSTLLYLDHINMCTVQFYRGPCQLMAFMRVSFMKCQQVHHLAFLLDSSIQQSSVWV